MRMARIGLGALRPSPTISSTKEENMRQFFCSMIVAGAALALAAGAANAAKGNRDAAMEKCFAEAQASAPDIVGSGSGSRRTAVYKDCMKKAGYRP
jgi:hypothetical protein